MKINYTFSGFTKTGGTIVLANIINRLAERGHQVSVTAYQGCFDLLSKNILQINAEKIITKASWYCARVVSAFFRNILKNEIYLNIYRELDIIEEIIPECDINVATYHLTAFPVFRSKKGIPFYHMQHYEVLFNTDSHRQALSEETYWIELNKIVNSIWLRNMMKQKYLIDCPIVNPAIDHDIFKPVDSKNKHKKRIVMYGSKAEWKGFKDALEAMKIVFKARNDIEWLVFGLSPLDYHDSDAPYQFIKGIFNEDLAKLYSSAHVVICPSWYESFPLPPLEAMACGAPLVTTKYGTEDYCFHEENSLVVPPQDPNSMAEAILRLLEDDHLSNTFIQKGIETAKQFTWDRTVDRVEELFTAALASAK